jgi:hypothetical protein
MQGDRSQALPTWPTGLSRRCVLLVIVCVLGCAQAKPVGPSVNPVAAIDVGNIEGARARALHYAKARMLLRNADEAAFAKLAYGPTTIAHEPTESTPASRSLIDHLEGTLRDDLVGPLEIVFEDTISQREMFQLSELTISLNGTPIVDAKEIPAVGGRRAKVFMGRVEPGVQTLSVYLVLKGLGPTYLHAYTWRLKDNLTFDATKRPRIVIALFPRQPQPLEEAPAIQFR